MKYLIVLPMAFYVLYVFCLMLISARVRFRAVRSKQMPIKYFASYAGEVPDAVQVAGRHFDNQFQLPTYFLIGCTAHLILGQLNVFTLVVAWGFVASRILHSFVHLGTNHIPSRMRVYLVSWIMNLLLWGQLVVFALAATEANAAEVDHTKWLHCSAHTECVYIDGLCGKPEPVNQKYRDEATKYWNLKMAEVKCSTAKAQAQHIAVKCVAKKCAVIDGK